MLDAKAFAEVASPRPGPEWRRLRATKTEMSRGRDQRVRACSYAFYERTTAGRDLRAGLRSWNARTSRSVTSADPPRAQDPRAAEPCPMAISQVSEATRRRQLEFNGQAWLAVATFGELLPRSKQITGPAAAARAENRNLHLSVTVFSTL